MKTRLFSLWLLLSVAVELSAYDFKVDGLCYNITNSTAPYSAEVANADKNLTIVNIPEIVTYKGVVYSVMRIGESAFSGCTGLTSITIPNSVMGIGNSAFSGCTGLTSITIPNSVTEIGSWAFSGCTGLTSVTIPNSVTSIGTSAFSGCTGLTSITIPNSVTSIGVAAFAWCTGLNTITIPNSVMSIGGGAFEGCTGLNRVNYTGDIKEWLDIKMVPYCTTNNPDYCNMILNFAQEMYINGVLLTELVIPEGITTISHNFRDYAGLTSVTIPNSVTSIDSYAFFGCTGLTSITIPNGVTSIGGDAFGGCTGLDTVIIGNGITEIDYQFWNCSSIRHLQLGSGVKSIGNEAFYASQKLKRIVCYAVEPPVAQKNSFYNYNIHVQVPCDNLEDYDTGVVWGDFKYIECMGADNVDTDGNVTVTPGDNEVEIIWPSDDSADTYSLVITQADKEVCTLVFNKNGQLIRIAFAAPAQNEEQRHTPAAMLTQSGYRFTVTGLSSGVQYAYAMDVKDKAGATIHTYEGTFTTTVNGTPTGVENVAIGTSSVNDAPRKVFRNGQVYILRGGKTYTTMGVEMNL